MSDQQLTVAWRYEEEERGVTSLVPRPCWKNQERVWQHGHTMPCPRGIPLHHFFVNVWGEALASPMNKDCCHDTSASNVYTAAWQEIVKPKALELCVLLSKQLLAIVETEQEDRPQFKQRTRFLAIQAAQRNSSQQYLCCGNITMAYRSWSEDGLMYLSQKWKLLLPLYQQQLFIWSHTDHKGTPSTLYQCYKMLSFLLATFRIYIAGHLESWEKWPDVVRS